MSDIQLKHMKKGSRSKVAVPRYNQVAAKVHLEKMKKGAPHMISLNDNRHDLAHQEERGPRYGNNRKMWATMKWKNRKRDRQQFKKYETDVP